MLVRELIRVIGELMQGVFLAPFWCAVVQLILPTFEPVPFPYALQWDTNIRQVSEFDNEILVLTRPRTVDSRLDRIGSATPETIFDITHPPMGVRATLPRFSDRLVIEGSAWWYAALHVAIAFPQVRPPEGVTTFIRSDGSRKTYASPSVETYHMWDLIVLSGQDPGAIELAIGESAVLARELEWRGPARSWKLPRRAGTSDNWTAERLPDGRIALAMLSVEKGLELFVLGDDGRIESSVLLASKYRKLATAIDDQGRIAVAVAGNDAGTVEGAVIDVAALPDAEWHTLGRSANHKGQRVRVIARTDDFVAAWQDEEYSIEAVAFDARGPKGTAVDVGPGSRSRTSHFFDVQTTGEELTFWWEDGGQLFRRRLPTALTAYAVLESFSESLCKAGTAFPHSPH